MPVALRVAWSLNVRMTRRPVQRAPWSRWSDERLLTLRFRELRLSRPSEWVVHCHQRLLQELAERSLRARPHVWLAEDWFSPQRHSGFRDPFLPRTPQTHATRACSDAFGRRWHAAHRAWRSCGTRRDTRFSTRIGSSAARRGARSSAHRARPIPIAIARNRRSTRFVRHLPGWYAQSHPDEDFAETFAVWLRPGSRWRTRYARWPVALAKLTYIDALMRDLHNVRPPVTSRARPLSHRPVLAHARRALPRDRHRAHRAAPPGWLTL